VIADRADIAAQFSKPVKNLLDFFLNGIRLLTDPMHTPA